MRPIPPKLREEMTSDPYYKSCVVGGECDGRIEFHHNLIYGGRQVNEKFCILPLCHYHHAHIAYFKEHVDRIMLNRATDEELRRYSKATDYIALRDRLNLRSL